MKVHDDQSVIEKTGSTPLKYSPTVLVSTLLESWPIPPLTCEQVDQNLTCGCCGDKFYRCRLSRLKVRELAEISNVNLRLS